MISDVDGGTWYVTATNILNPGYVKTIDNFLIYSWANYTNTIVEWKSVAGPNVAVGTL